MEGNDTEDSSVQGKKSISSMSEKELSSEEISASSGSSDATGQVTCLGSDLSLASSVFKEVGRSSTSSSLSSSRENNINEIPDVTLEEQPPQEITEIQHPLSRRRRNYKVTKKHVNKRMIENVQTEEGAISLPVQHNSTANKSSMTSDLNNTDRAMLSGYSQRLRSRLTGDLVGADSSTFGSESVKEERHSQDTSLRFPIRNRLLDFESGLIGLDKETLPETQTNNTQTTATGNMERNLDSIYDNTEFFLPYSFDLEDGENDDDYDNMFFLEMNIMDGIEHFNNINIINLARERDSTRQNSSPYPRGSLVRRTECGVCYEKTSIRKRLCCDFPVCEECMGRYIEDKVNTASVTIQCIGFDCNSFIHRDEILGRLSGEMKEKYYRFLVEANQDPLVKTCPRCSAVFNFTKDQLQTAKRKSKGRGVNVTCQNCDLGWCFLCHAPSHQDLSCKEFRKGDKLLRSWAKVKSRGRDVNAQKCPRCKVFIERKGGCDHMTCKQCGTSFCYRCGERYISTNIVTKLIGDHHGRYSPFGCKYNLMPNDPCARKLIRGSVLGAKVLGGILLGGVLLAAGAILVGTSFIILPAYKGYHYHKHRQDRKRMKKCQKLYLSGHFLSPPEIPKLTLNSHLQDGLELPGTDNFPPDFDNQETDEDSTNDESPESVTDQDPSREVEVWVHCHHQNDTEISENECDDGNEPVTMTTAKISKDQDDNEVLYVKTSYACKGNKEENARIASSPDPDENCGKEELPLSLTEKSSGNNSKSVLVKKTSENDSPGNEDDENSDVETETGDENSVTQGCFVRIFGKKLPVVWEKDKEGEMIKTTENKQDSGTLEKKKQVVDALSITLDGSLEKKKLSPSSVSVDSSLEKKKKAISNKGGNVQSQGQPDIVTCVLQSKQANEKAGKGSHDSSNDDETNPDFDPYYGLVSADDFETTL